MDVDTKWLRDLLVGAQVSCREHGKTLTVSRIDEVINIAELHNGEYGWVIFVNDHMEWMKRSD